MIGSRLRVKKDDFKNGVKNWQGYCTNDDGNNPPPYCPVDDASYTFRKNRNYEAMNDVSTPLFRKISGEGGIINSPMQAERLTCVTTPSHQEVEMFYSGVLSTKSTHVYHRVAEEPWLPVTSFNSPFVDYIDEQLDPYETERQLAVTQAWAKVDESEMMALATLGESPETIRWFLSVYGRMIGVLKAFRAKRLRLFIAQSVKRVKTQGTVKTVDALLNNWMEMRYAIRPLIFEMQQIVALLERKAKPVRRTARGYHRVTDESSETDWYNGDGYWIQFQDRVVTTRNSEYRAGVLYGIEQLTGNWKELLGIDKPLESMWELTRLSFALDWFFNVGDIIASHTTSANLTPYASWITENHTFTYDSEVLGIRVRSDLPTPPWTISMNAAEKGSHVYVRTVKRRLPDTEPSWLPSIKIKLDWKKVVDLIAIGRSIYRSIKR